MNSPTDEQSAIPVTPVELGDWINPGLTGQDLIRYMVRTHRISFADAAFLITLREELARRREKARIRREVLRFIHRAITLSPLRSLIKKILNKRKNVL